MYPPQADIRVFQLENSQQVEEIKDSAVKHLPIPDILGYNQAQKK